jgi:hypothetical protein
MDWGYKAVLTATTLALLLTVVQVFGRGLAGILAGLPMVSGPAVLWLALENGSASAFEAGLGIVSGCAVCAGFALAYVRGSRIGGAWTALALAAAAAAAALWSLGTLLAGSLMLAVCVSLVAVMGVYRLIRVPRAEPARHGPRLRGEPFITAGVAGAVSGAVALAAPTVGPFWAGMLASSPYIAAIVAVQQHALDGPGASAVFLRGYVGGLIGRIGFGAAFALLPMVLPTSLAAALAFVAGCLFTALGVRLLRERGGARSSAQSAEFRRV